MTDSVPSHETSVRVRYAETDAMQVVYHANYFVWFEVGRCDLLRSLGQTYRTIEAAGLMLPVVEAQCDYRRSARYDDELTIHTSGKLLSSARIRFDYEIRQTEDAVVAAIGRTVHAAVNRDGRPVRLPVAVRKIFG